MIVSRGKFSLVYDGCAEMAGTNFCDNHVVGHQVFRIFILQQSLLCFKLILLMWSPNLRPCVSNSPRNILECPIPGRFSQRDAVSFSCLSLVLFYRCSSLFRSAFYMNMWEVNISFDAQINDIEQCQFWIRRCTSFEANKLWQHTYVIGGGVVWP